MQQEKNKIKDAVEPMAMHCIRVSPQMAWHHISLEIARVFGDSWGGEGADVTSVFSLEVSSALSRNCQKPYGCTTESPTVPREA